MRLKATHGYMARERSTGMLTLFNGTTGAAAKPRTLGWFGEYNLVG
jgi:hypothetical protein